MNEDGAWLRVYMFVGIWLALAGLLAALTVAGLSPPPLGLIPNGLVFVALGVYEVRHRHYLTQEWFGIRYGPSYAAVQGVIAILLGLALVVGSLVMTIMYS